MKKSHKALLIIFITVLAAVCGSIAVFIASVNSSTFTGQVTDVQKITAENSSNVEKMIVTVRNDDDAMTFEFGQFTEMISIDNRRIHFSFITIGDTLAVKYDPETLGDENVKALRSEVVEQAPSL